MDEKLKEYKERERYWTSNSVSQLSLTIQITMAISVGFMSFALKPDLYNFSVDACFIKIILSILYGLLVILSLLFGFLALFSRLYDGRITRNIAYTRRKYYQEKSGLLKDDTPKKVNLMQLTQLLRNNVYLIKIEDIKDDSKSFITRFHKNREIAHNLGIVTWCFHKYQIFLLFTSIFLYFLSLFFQ